MSARSARSRRRTAEATTVFPGHEPDPLIPTALRLSEVARHLSISRAAAYRLVQSGQLPGIRIGTSVRVLNIEFDAYLERVRAEAEQRYRRVRG